MAKMNAIVVGENGPELKTIDRPEPGANQVLIKVRAAALNRADLYIATGFSHGTKGGENTIMGFECAGDVCAVGTGVRQFCEGDKVMGFFTSGYAEYALCEAYGVYKIPNTNINYQQATCFPSALNTMHNAIVSVGGLQSGESVLIQGASSGIGIIGMQIAKYKGASIVVGSSTNEFRRGKLTDFGADLAVDSSDPRWVDEVVAATNGAGVDLVVDQVSAPVANDNMRATRVLGRIVNVGRLGGANGNFDYDLHSLKRISYHGVTFRTRNQAEVQAISEAMQADLWQGLEDGAFQIPIDRIFPLEKANAALDYMATNQHFGKIILDVNG